MVRALPEAFDLSGRAALVTGAGSPTGIGFAAARLLGELGASVALVSTTDRIIARADELRAGDVAATGHVADLTDPIQVERVVAEVVSAHGRLDIVVNNAGMASVGLASTAGSGSVLQTGLDDWRAGMARNLDTAFLVTRASLPHLVAGQWGRVVFVSSVTGPVMAMRSEAAYAAAKAAMVGLARSVAVDHATDGITANTVAPGWIATGSQTPHEHLEGLASPTGRSADPAEVAAAIGWLCTPGAAYVTGQCLVVDGGNSIAEERAL
ncbi:MAG: SDR family oxidoreductase [Actinomycetota bacterium]|nr:SDR family oxidoreductase [Actinomycetota bacterium]